MNPDCILWIHEKPLRWDTEKNNTYSFYTFTLCQKVLIELLLFLAFLVITNCQLQNCIVVLSKIIRVLASTTWVRIGKRTKVSHNFLYQLSWYSLNLNTTMISWSVTIFFSGNNSWVAFCFSVIDHMSNMIKKLY